MYWINDKVKNRIIFLKFTQKYVFKEKKFWLFESFVYVVKLLTGGIFERNWAGRKRPEVPAVLFGNNQLHEQRLFAHLSDVQFLHL